jgi:DNA-binding transcriptional ArsR family regulator
VDSLKGREKGTRGLLESLAQPLGISLPAVVQHLAVLEASGLIHSEKTGRVRLCRLEPKGFAAAENRITARKAFWERRLDRLGGLLDEE